MKGTDFGAYKYDYPGEDEVIRRFLWSCMLNMSFKGKCILIYGVIFNKPPKWLYDIKGIKMDKEI